ncbi:MAG: putative lipid II flippase FtsW [Solirubrobacterales bacterium]|nr:putative lipid II flippase FtsW [Solirubrobacterales bacterium]
MASASASAPGARSGRAAAPARRKRPVEYSILYTATLCMVAIGAVMVYSASSAESLLDGSGDPLMYLKRYVSLGLIGLVAMLFAARHGLALVRRLTPAILGVGFVLTAAVMLPGLGVTVNGARSWLGAGPLQFQPSELLKVALVLYAAQLLASRPRSVETLGGIARPLLIVVGAAALLLMAQPDMGTLMVICAAMGMFLLIAGTPLRLIGGLGAALAGAALVAALIEPYRMARLTAFLNPFADSHDTGFQTVQGLTAIGSGGLFGVGLGESVQKVFYLPEAHTDMILAIIGEELGLIGVAVVIGLYVLIGYAGLRTAKAARDRYSKLLAAGITSLILCQATLNIFAVLGLAPLTGVPLPFISYGSTNLIVLLGAMGLLLNIAATGGLPRTAAQPRPRLRSIDGGRAGEGGDRGRRDGRPRRAGAGDRRRSAG